ncbi:MAG: hypothetical protein ACRDU0_07440 [Mycobacterium sp.]
MPVDEDELLLLADAQTSGGLLLGVPAEADAEVVADRLRIKDLATAIVGRVTVGPAGHVRVRVGNG